MVEEVFVVSASGSGHLFPCIELCEHLFALNYTTTLVLPSPMSSAISSSQLHHVAAVVNITAPERGKPQSSSDPKMGSELEAHLSARSNRPDPPQIACAIVDFPMSWIRPIFWKFKIPVVSFFTFGACAAAMEWGAWKSGASEINPGEIHHIPGLPDEMNISYQDLGCKSSQRPRAAGSGGPRPGELPPWVPLVEGSIGLMFNTCDDLEHPFLEYLGNQMGLPLWGVGPLLPNQFWELSNTLIHDVQIRQPKHPSDHSEDKVLNWLDTKPQNSVLYVAFGSQVSPTNEEYMKLSSTLEQIKYPFIWVVLQNWDSLDFDALDKKVGDRGLIIKCWAPQLLILSHPSVGGFLSHCGWNSTLEAIGRGVPILAWPIRGDQIYNAKLVVKYLKIGYMALPSDSFEMIIDDLRNGIEKLMTGEEVHERAEIVRSNFSSGFPANSKAAFHAFQDFVKQNQIC